MKSKYKKRRWISFMMANLVAFSSILSSAPVLADTTTDAKDITIQESAAEQDTTRIYVNNTPIRLEVSKIKTPVGSHEGLSPHSYGGDNLENTITYKWTGRIDGTISQIIQTYGSGNIELAYAPNGTYLGYGWKTGTLEYLQYRQENEAVNNEIVDIKYNEYGVFEGYGYITKILETADDYNRYVAGAVMTLYDAVEIYQNPSLTGDDRFPGVVVKRNSNSDVTSAYVTKGYAGNKIEYVLSKDGADDLDYNENDGINDSGEGTWIIKTIERSDTPILYYSLNDLNITTNDIYKSGGSENQSEVDKVFGANRYDKEQTLYGFNRNGDVINASQRDEYDFTIFAFRRGDIHPIFEFVGGNFEDIKYNSLSRTIELGVGTIMYHLDEDGNRDAKVDPQTGIAYITEDMLTDEITKDSNEPHIVSSDLRQKSYQTYGRIYVWPVNIYKDGTGSETFEKIKTSRIATINEDTEDEYTIGTYTGSDFTKKLLPVYDENGLPIYYTRSDQTYEKGADRFDRDDDYLGYAYGDGLDDENKNAYQIKDHQDLYNGDANDPFDQSTQYQYSTTQKIRLTVDIDGNYIVKGAESVPIPRRSGRVFAGWLVEPEGLSDGAIVNASWKVAGSTMDDNQQQKWYSNREATGTTQTLTVTFHANGGEFFDGSGDIHSADNKLYHRQGEAYIIENTWVTGENTPNNPFDEREVATVDMTSDTANDPYRALGTDGHQKGGNVDVIKRVFPGRYILEELSAPVGYTKGLPVGVKVNENSDVQTAEMVDSTIKVEISKVDGVDDYSFHIYRDGELAADSAGIKEVVAEPKGSYRFTNVPEAKLAIYGNNKDNADYHNWVRATAFAGAEQKYYDDVHGDYIVVDTSNPIYIEGIPAGNYIISEIDTPSGFITAPDTKVRIKEEKDVQLVLINDDHTKLEIKKYHHDGNQHVVLPNMYQAGLQLKDIDGNVVSEWYTDDVRDYDGFRENYEQLVKLNYGANFDSISWDVMMTARLHSTTALTEKWLLSDGSIVTVEDDYFSNGTTEAFKDAYHQKAANADTFTYTITKTAAKQSGTPTNQHWLTEDGISIKICVYEDNDFDTDGKQNYICEYKFNYRDNYSGIYKNMISYDTVDGLHRFDYIPVGIYVLHEFDVPDGFVQADDKQLEVQETGDIQQYTMLNEHRNLVITKVGQSSDNLFYAGLRNNEVMMGQTGIEIAGATLRLYQVDRFDDAYKQGFKNNLIPDGASLIAEWVSGSNGVYTSEDERKEQIPSGYQVGDFKPYTIKNLEDGCYYLVEAETPDYYRTAEPLEVLVDSKRLAFTVMNKQMPGKVEVSKMNEQGEGLAGASFTVKNQTTGLVAGYIITGDDGCGTLIIDEIGVIGKDGAIEPYIFAIEETSPPEGYQLTGEVRTFQFDGKSHDGYAFTYNEMDELHQNGIITFINKETLITISKSDFDTHLAVNGATLAVYEAEFAEGGWTAKGTALAEWVTSTDNNEYTIKGLVGTKTYVLIETTVPTGYIKAEDIFFRIAANGRGIAKIWTDATANSYIEFLTDYSGAVEKVNFSTKAFAGSKTILKDLNDNTSREYGTATNGFTLSGNEIIDGHTYQMNEIVRFTDNTERLIRSTTFVARLDEGSLKIHPKNAVAVENLVMNSNGTMIAKWYTDGDVYSVENPLKIDGQGITITNTSTDNRVFGQDHEAVSAGQQIVYTINYEGSGKEIILKPDAWVDVIRTEPAAVVVSDGSYRWTSTDDRGVVKFVVTVKDSATGNINQKVTIDGRSYSYMNPIAVNEGTGFLKETSKIVLFNDVIGNDPNNETAIFTYRLTLTDEAGNPLNGSYRYWSKNEDAGSRKFEAYGQDTTFDVTLMGTDYLVIDSLPYGTKYSIRLLVTNDFGFQVQSGTVNDEGYPIHLPEGSTQKERIANVYFANTRYLSNERQIFLRNESYEIIERVVMSDGTLFAFAQSGFTLGDNCEVKSFDMKNRNYPIMISKQHVSGKEELAGARLQILDMAENVIEEWVSTGTEHVLTAVLIPGENYILREVAPPAGYSFADDIIFTVNPDGTIDYVIMYDLYTKVYIAKVDENGRAVVGAKLQILDSDGTLIEEWISDGSNHEIINQLNVGASYTLREITPPNGYTYANDIVFTIPEDGIITVTMIDYETEVQITKKSSEIDEAGNLLVLNGALLQILDSEKNPVIAMKDTNNFNRGDLLKFRSNETVNITGLLNAGVTYYLRELEPVDGYAYAEDVAFVVSQVHEITSVMMVDEPIIVTITKTDITGETELSGAYLKITDKDGNFIDEWISEAAVPHVIIKRLIAGKTYVLTEVVSPEGYAYTANIEFKVELDGSITITDQVIDNNHIFVKDKPTDVRISKVDITNNDELSGAHLSIKDKDGTIIEEWISTNEQHQIIAKLIAGETYYLHEILSPEGYAYANVIEFTVSLDGTIDMVKMEDKLTQVEISKTDITTGTEIIGAHLQILDMEDNENPVVIEEWLSTGVPHLLKKVLIAGKTYTLHEVSAPDGYTLASDIIFTVSLDGRIDKVVMEDRPTQLEISKKDIAGTDELPGALLQIIDKDGIIIEEWISTNEPHMIKAKLKAGETYILHEEMAPEGYGYSVDIEFTISFDGQIDQVLMLDKPTHVEILKVDAMTELTLDGAVLQILDKDGKIVEEWLSTNQAHKMIAKLIAGETYTLHEVKAPEGYGYFEDITFTVSLDGRIDRIIAEDKPTQVEISKKTITGDEELPGAHLQIVEKDGTVIEEWISTDKPHIIRRKLIAGKSYTLVERFAPDGYGYAQDIEFTVSLDGSIDQVEMRDDTLKISIIKWKENQSDLSDTGNMLGGARMQIKDSSGQVVEEWITEAGKIHEMVSLFPSTGIYIIPDEVYTLSEVSAPSGWTVANDQTFTAAHDGTLKVLHVIDHKKGKPGISTPTITITKNDAANLSAGVAGAEYTIYNSNGTMYMVLITDNNGRATFPRPVSGTYTYQETKAPDGYMIDKNIYMFTVKDGTVSGTLNVKDWPETEIEIHKKDSETKAPLPGAILEIYDSQSNFVVRGETGLDGVFPFIPHYDDTYTVVEVKAPEGYPFKENTFIKFTVKDGQVTGETTIYNDKGMIGTITATYDYGANGKGHVWIDENGKVHFGKTGDSFNFAFILTGWVVAAGGLIILFKRRKRHGQR